MMVLLRSDANGMKNDRTATYRIRRFVSTIGNSLRPEAARARAPWGDDSRACAAIVRSWPALFVPFLRLRCSRCATVLFVTDLFHPVDDCAIDFFRNGDMGHGTVWCSSVPVLHTGRDPDNIPLPDLLYRPPPPLYPTSASGHDQGLAERVGVPGCPGAAGVTTSISPSVFACNKVDTISPY